MTQSFSHPIIQNYHSATPMKNPLSRIFVAVLLCQTMFGLAQPKMAVQLYSFRDEFAKDVPGTMAKVKQMGFKYVELAGTYGLSVPDFQKMLAQNGLTAIGTGVDFKVWEQNPAQGLADAKTFGVKYAGCFWIPHNGTDFTIDDMKKAVAVFNKAGKLLKENGVQFFYHPHGFEFRPYEDGTLFDYLLKNTNPDYVKFEMDTFWITHPGQDPVAILEKYAGRFPLIHAKDRAKGTVGNQNGQADVETNVVLGTGDVGMAEVMRAAHKTGVDYVIIEDESSRSVAQVPMSVAFLKKSGIK